MNTPHQHRWLAWLLPLFLLRAFIPVGFMVSWSDAGLQVVMCSGMGPMPVQSSLLAHSPAAHKHHVPAGSQQHDSSRSHDTTVCPFAAAGTSGGLPAFDAIVAFTSVITDRVPTLSYPHLPATTVLIDRIRGPPVA